MSDLPSRALILSDITSILADHMGAASGGIDEDTRFFADLGLASIDAVVLGEALQQHYGRPLPFADLLAEIGRRTDRDVSIGELVTFLRAHLGDGTDRS